MNRIDTKFRELRTKGQKALLVYLTCGYPDMNTTEKLVLELEGRGVDIIELGIPFSDPLADGPIIQAASNYALKKKVHLPAVFSLVRSLRKKTQIPLCLMGYYNPIFSYGQVRFVSEAVKAGVDGIIIADLPPEEDSWLVSLARKQGLKTIFFLSPTSSIKRLKYISKVSSGFIYYVSLTGVTGARENLSADLRQNILKIKKYTQKPLCVGFGISCAKHIAQIFKIADGAIVGSAVIKVIRDNLGAKDLLKKVGRFVGGLNVRKKRVS
ncbi:MAG: tryptophan synthase subunit alpha [Omnitrophica WOR_2 bacterium RIFCSPHIGHO2_02_FULL_45_21]|nr:MAG: tryptophan synthase subunit alpha [Omnitrophica WOR_2 bacterium RIFCSPHIGHO2_02_FULL_45_21]